MAEPVMYNPSSAENALFLGYATVPLQQLQTTYPLEDAMRAGTLFPELDLPYALYGKEGYRP